MNGYPNKQGLYNPNNEHDACGIGAIANIKGIKSHSIINNALNILVHLEHRGGTGAEDNTGDGAGILFQIPHKFFLSCSFDFKLPNEGEYAVAQLFLSRNDEYRNKALEIFLDMLSKEGLIYLGRREVPYNDYGIGKTALNAMPYILQLFYQKPSEIQTGMDFERLLYLARRKAEKEIIKNNIQDFYVCSFSSKTIVYKGMLKATQVRDFYIDLQDLKFETAIALVHSRFSTNTFPSWQKAHPNRYICHNGEINTIRGNVNAVKGREGLFKSPIFKDNLDDVLPAITCESSDSAMFDNFLEFLYFNGRSIEEAIMLTVPEPWTKNETMDSKLKAYYEFNSCLMEPWDGPASIIFTDGDKLGASLDRNGLRPSRYCLTDDDEIIIYSETGALPIPEEKIIEKRRLEPGKLLLVDTKLKKVISNEEIKQYYANKFPYYKWNSNLIKIDHFNTNYKYSFYNQDKLTLLQKLYKYTNDEILNGITYMANHHEEKIVAMGVDTPLPMLSKDEHLLYDFFRQNFAQVTNPPIDAIREDIVTSSRIYLGREGNLLIPSELNAKRVKLSSPIITNEELYKIKSISNENFKVKTISITYNVNQYNLETAIYELCLNALDLALNDTSIIILSDRDTDETHAAIPALLALSAVHKYLYQNNSRTHVSIVLESAEPREIHHFACLIGYGVTAICPYLAYETINQLCDKKQIVFPYEEAINNYVIALNKGIIKIISKMGISTLQSYSGAQIFEAIGLDDELIDKYFPNTTNSISGVGIKEIEEKLLDRHYKAYNHEDTIKTHDDSLLEKNIISLLQDSCKNNDYKKFEEYANLVDSKLVNVRDLFTFDTSNVININEVESVESIVKRFKTGAMSYGAISEEAHECLAMAMNKIGALSNSGEGGENPFRYKINDNGLDRCSYIKQVASGRFGVDMNYLLHAKELQIKVAQGAKPGEGGQLPSKKVYPSIARARHSTPGVSLISPPPHHDIYSIEDLAQLIYDLKNANRDALISVKLVSEAGVGTVSSGVVKAGANKILISGFDGGTGAAPRTSVPNAGMPWEIGLAEAHQTLLLNNLRERVKLETDGKLLTGRDIAIAALLGADEYGFATAPLIVMGCKMLRVCNLNTCPFGVATQKDELRKKFQGKVDDVVNFMYFMAENLRHYMALLGFRTVNEMIGRVDKIKVNQELASKLHINLDKLLYNPIVLNKTNVCFKEYKETSFDNTLDQKVLLPLCKDSIINHKKINIDLEISNVNRSLGTILSSEIVKHNEEGLPNDTININCIGNAGNSLGAFLTKGVTIKVNGDANDYIGKGLCGGKLIITPNKSSKLISENNIIAGNVILYGATSGDVYLNGLVGERFCVRNSGANAIALGCGEHGCEYMTGGKVIILGDVGNNFASGMSGGIAYIYGNYNEKKINRSLVDIYDFTESDNTFVKQMISNFVKYTKNQKAKMILDNYNPNDFIKVMPRDYKKVTDLINKYTEEGNPDPMMAAFLESTK